MIILHEAGRPYNLNSLTDPVSISHFWSFSGHLLDFKLETLDYIEETTGPTVTLEVAGTVLKVPSSWTLLAVDRETFVIDTVPVTTCATHEHDILLFSPDDTKLVTTKIKVIDFNPSDVCIHPQIPKGSALCHKVAEVKGYKSSTLVYSIVASPYDLHRYIGGKAVGEILG